MELRVFDDQSRPPEDADLAMALKRTFVYWNELKGLMASRFTPVTYDWVGNSKKGTWGMRLKQNKRTILYMSPCDGYFLASFALGEKAVRAARDSNLPGSVLAVIEGAKKYAEGRGVRLEVRNAKDLHNVEVLAAIKMST